MSEFLHNQRTKCNNLTILVLKDDCSRLIRILDEQRFNLFGCFFLIVRAIFWLAIRRMLLILFEGSILANKFVQYHVKIFKVLSCKQFDFVIAIVICFRQVGQDSFLFPKILHWKLTRLLLDNCFFALACRCVATIIGQRLNFLLTLDFHWLMIGGSHPIFNLKALKIHGALNRWTCSPTYLLLWNFDDVITLNAPLRTKLAFLRTVKSKKVLIFITVLSKLLFYRTFLALFWLFLIFIVLYRRLEEAVA